MLTLAINTASPKIEIALLKGKSRIAGNSWESHTDETQKLLPAISLMLKKTQRTFEDIDRLLVHPGPGSFSALRIGVTVANTLRYALGIPMYTMQPPSVGEYRIKRLRLKKVKIVAPKYSLPPKITMKI